MEIEQVAKICHEANRVYCEEIGDNSQTAWGDAPDWQRDSAMKGVECHLEALRGGQELSPAESHNSWMAVKRGEGWKWGPEKNPEKKEHPCMVLYDDLPAKQRAKDRLFGAIVKAFFRSGILP